MSSLKQGGGLSSLWERKDSFGGKDQRKDTNPVHAAAAVPAWLQTPRSSPHVLTAILPVRACPEQSPGVTEMSKGHCHPPPSLLPEGSWLHQ